MDSCRQPFASCGADLFPKTFHARFSAKGKTYRYRIWNAAVLPPFESGRAWHVVNPLDFERMVRAAKEFRGEHDFASFSANRGTPETNTVRTIRAVRVRRSWSLHFDGIRWRRVPLQDGANDGGNTRARRSRQSHLRKRSRRGSSRREKRFRAGEPQRRRTDYFWFAFGTDFAFLPWKLGPSIALE